MQNSDDNIEVLIIGIENQLIGQFTVTYIQKVHFYVETISKCDRQFTLQYHFPTIYR